MSNNSRYVILSTDDVTWKMVNLSTSARMEDLRKNNDNTKCILEVPQPVNDVFLDYQLYSNLEIMDILAQDPEWTPEEQ